MRDVAKSHKMCRFAATAMPLAYAIHGSNAKDSQGVNWLFNKMPWDYLHTDAGISTILPWAFLRYDKYERWRKLPLRLRHPNNNNNNNQ